MLSETNCLVAQSGGPTTVINASLAGVIAKALNRKEITKIYGSLNGITGVLEDRLMDLSETFCAHKEDLELLKYSPSMFLGSCRYKLAPLSETTNDYVTIFQLFQKYKIKYFCILVEMILWIRSQKLSKYAKSINFDIKIIGIPKNN